jgi:hypothetical protein
VRDTTLSRDIDAMLGSASPRKPSVATASRSSRLAILLVACRDKASASWSRPMPTPSSRIRISFAPATLYIDVDAPRAGIETVLDQFLHDGRGPLDDLASSDLIDELGR